MSVNWIRRGTFMYYCWRAIILKLIKLRLSSANIKNDFIAFSLQLQYKHLLLHIQGKKDPDCLLSIQVFNLSWNLRFEVRRYRTKILVSRIYLVFENGGEACRRVSWIEAEIAEVTLPGFVL